MVAATTAARLSKMIQSSITVIHRWREDKVVYGELLRPDAAPEADPETPPVSEDNAGDREPITFRDRILRERQTNDKARRRAGFEQPCSIIAARNPPPAMVIPFKARRRCRVPPQGRVLANPATKHSDGDGEPRNRRTPGTVMATP